MTTGKSRPFRLCVREVVSTTFQCCPCKLTRVSVTLETTWIKDSPVALYRLSYTSWPRKSKGKGDEGVLSEKQSTHMRHINSIASALCLGIMTVAGIYGQTAAATDPKPGTDTLLLTNGEKLVGHLESATDKTVVFKSDTIGEVKLDWSKIQELHSSGKFAAIPKGTKLHRSEDTGRVPQGAISMTDQRIEVTGAQAAPQTIPVGNIGNVVNEGSFQKAFQRTSFLHGWTGGATAGVALTEATQNSTSFTAAINMVRTVPAGDWLDPRSRTIVGFNEAYGKITQPGTPTVKTSLYHLGVEQDWYLSPRLFAFAHAILDHSFSQGLDLQQTYGGGLGLVVFKETNQELDFKASVDYIDQRFETSSFNRHLIGSTFSETYLRTFVRGILLNEQAGISPAWNDTSAYSAFASAALTFPVYHHFGLTLGALDDFLNNPPPGFKKNSFQFTAGATYSF